MSTINPKLLLRRMFDAATAAADPSLCVSNFLPSAPKGRTVVLGAGKASASMAWAVEKHWKSPISGLVITRYGYAKDCESIEIVEASHPLPDEAGLNAAKRTLEIAQSLGSDDLCIMLMSGGASSLLTLPPNGMTLADKQAINEALLCSGATITEMNCVRKHLSAIKGGRLAEAIHPARIVNLLISDVTGDAPEIIGSGPTMPDPKTFEDARKIITKYDMSLPNVATNIIREGLNETPKPGSVAFSNSETHVITKPQSSLEAAEKIAAACGLKTLILGSNLEGEARDIGVEHAQLALSIKEGTGIIETPAVILSGGELTVTVKGKGRGGPNAEYILAMAIELAGTQNIYAIACDTDGIDGSENNAGAQLTPDSINRAHQIGLDPRALLQCNDSYSFFQPLDDLIMSGPTYTNVNDFRALMVLS